MTRLLVASLLGLDATAIGLTLHAFQSADATGSAGLWGFFSLLLAAIILAGVGLDARSRVASQPCGNGEGEGIIESRVESGVESLVWA